MLLAVPLVIAAVSIVSEPAAPSVCIECHKRITPGIVNDWQLSKHAENAVTCDACHGDEHKAMDDFAKVRIPTPDTCATCHSQQVDQFKRGKHAHAWAAMNAMPMAHAQPVAMTQGQKGCGGCHKIGLKTEEETRVLKKEGAGFGLASCDACHTRHLFSVAEARQPQACQTCHMGFDHPQWEMYSASKHGVRALLKQTGAIPENASAPTCQTCHMQDGDHEVRTPWGFLAVRLPLPEDKSWAADQATILKALGVLDPEGNPTARLEVVKQADVARLDAASFDKERAKLTKACKNCHSENFVKLEIEKGDKMIREADHLLAEAITIVADLYKDRILQKPTTYPFAYPDLLTFHDAPTPIEQRLFVMHLEHRMRTFQGTFHNNPDYALWYGWSEMQRDLTEIKAMAAEMRARHAGK